MSRKGELETLQSREAARAQQSQATTAAFAQQVMSQVQQQGPAIVQKIMLLGRALMTLLDNWVMPADLPATLIASADGQERKDLMQLHQLALALDEAPGQQNVSK